MTDQPLTKIAEGREAEVLAYGDGLVLRLMRSPDARPALEQQAAATRAARAAGVPVPEVHDIVDHDGRPGLVMERLDGPDLLSLIARRPWSVLRTFAIAGAVQAQLHDVVAPEGIVALKEGLARRIEASPLVPAGLARVALDALAGLPDGDRLCHGDFHPGNIIQTASGPVLIDWSNVTRGDPAADVARSDLILRLGEPPPGSPAVIRLGAKVLRGALRGAYLRAYRRARPLDMELVGRWTLPVAVHRLTENIVEERQRLLRLLDEPPYRSPP
jgi:aminoglycoside phosphotransferase (APT) family kinase protein